MTSKKSTSTPVDVVAVPSLRADGTPDQTPGFVTLDKDAAKAQAEDKKAADEGSAEAQKAADDLKAEKA